MHINIRRNNNTGIVIKIIDQTIYGTIKNYKNVLRTTGENVILAKVTIWQFGRLEIGNSFIQNYNFAYDVIYQA